MAKRFGIESGARYFLLLLVGAAVASAQMGGRAGAGGIMSGTAGNSLGGMMGGSLSGMMGGGSGLTIGPDGTIYLTRSAPAQNQSQTATTQLAAIDVAGNIKWSLSIGSAGASQPALGKDGTLFVTTSNWLDWMYDWMYSRSIPAAGATANLLVVKPGATSATVLGTIPLAGQLASAPQIAADSSGNYVIYVVVVDAFSGLTVNTSATSGSYLYSFSPTGVLKYKLQLSRGGYGMMGVGLTAF